VLFVEAPRDEMQVERIARAFDVPLLYNYASGGRSPLLPFAQLRALGYAILILPIDTLLVATRAMADFLAGLRERDDVRGLPTPSISFADFHELIGTTEQVTLAERYRSFPE
jgi:2,3-dimethylmalate lyase